MRFQTSHHSSPPPRRHIAPSFTPPYHTTPSTGFPDFYAFCILHGILSVTCIARITISLKVKQQALFQAPQERVSLLKLPLANLHDTVQVSMFVSQWLFRLSVQNEHFGPTHFPVAVVCSRIGGETEDQN
jgi:hypothetical protein